MLFINIMQLKCTILSYVNYRFQGNKVVVIVKQMDVNKVQLSTARNDSTIITATNWK